MLHALQNICTGGKKGRKPVWRGYKIPGDKSADW
jgi:hypothetical protein